ncbi:MAG: hypothetical protein ACYCWW_06465 [Deltaproteobacteria bacterium]
MKPALLALALSSAIACAPSSLSSTDAGPKTAPDGGRDAGADAGPPPCAPACPGWLACVGGSCLPIACAGGGACPTGLSCVSGYCQGGSCNPPCPSDQVCVGNACQQGGCATGQTLCPGAGSTYCADLGRDPDNCGACATVCAAGLACEDGGCTATCAGSGGTICAGRCVDLASDQRNCGACGSGCSPGEACADGGCQASCPAGESPCASDAGSACVDLALDVNDCGACGVACPVGQRCVASVCKSQCQSAADCLNGQFCSAGQCVPACQRDSDCPAGQGCVVATGQCQQVVCNLQSDCPAGEVCNEGQCATLGFGIPGVYTDGGAVARGPDAGPGAEWPTLHGNYQRTGVVASPGSPLTSPLPVWRYPLGQALTRKTGLVAQLLGDGSDYASVQGGRVVIRRADGSLQARSAYLGVDTLVGSADLDGSGQPVLVAVTTAPPSVHLVSPTDGSVLFAITSFPVGSSVIATLIPDVDGDGLPELALWALGFAPSYSQVIGVYSFGGGDMNGVPLWWYDWPTFNYLNPPLLGDLTGSGKPQLVALPDVGAGPYGIFDAKTGAQVVDDVSGKSCISSAAYLRDLDNSGKQQLVAVTASADGFWCHLVAVYDAVPNGGTENGATVTCNSPYCLSARWSLYGDRTVADVTLVAPWEDSLADLDGTGHQELVYGIFDVLVGSWQTQIRDASTGALLATIPDAIPLDVVQSGPGAVILTLAEPSQGLAFTGNVTAQTFTRSSGAVSTLWTQSNLTPLWRTWRPVPQANEIAAGSGRALGGLEGPGLTTLPYGSGQTAIVWESSSGAVAPGGRPDTLALLDLQAGTPLATAPMAPDDLVTGYERSGQSLWLSSRALGIELFGLSAGSFSKALTVPGGGFLASPPLVKRNGGTPEIFVSDAVGDTHVLALPAAGGGRLVSRDTLPFHQSLAALVDLTGDGGTQMLVQDQLPGSNVVELVAEGAASPLWTVPLATQTTLLHWADVGHFGPQPPALGFVLQVEDEISTSNNALWAVKALDGTTLWKNSGPVVFSGRGGTLLDYNFDGVDDEANCSIGNDCGLFDGRDGGLVLDFGAVKPVGIPVDIAAPPPPSGATSHRVYIGGLAYDTTGVQVSSSGAGSLLWSAASGSNGAPAMVDVNGDGIPDAVYWDNTDDLVARDGLTGAIAWQEGLSLGARVPFSLYVGRAKSAPAVADITGSGVPKIVLTAQDGFLYALNLDGTVDFALDFQSELSDPVLADVTGAGGSAILVTADDGNLYVVMQP